MVTGEIVLAELGYDDATFSFVFSDPIQIVVVQTENGEMTTAKPYIIGTDQRVFNISTLNVVTYGKADEFYSKFYASSLYKFFAQKQIKATSSGASVEEAEIKVQEMREYLNDKYGFVNEVDFNSNKVLH